ncbi:hypothetical protein TNCV_4723241 [Trichonephila clavipes]|uniref:Uncharacterized protein n=1 Tax=Trichonephila clavipes TaxID=2585209 RepID=A0A8X6W7E4_TRICX|nr:hypothetical protein TNCV_4723241 [Trichonephila clavipes]
MSPRRELQSLCETFKVSFVFQGVIVAASVSGSSNPGAAKDQGWRHGKYIEALTLAWWPRHSPVRLAYQVFEPKEGADDQLPPLIFQHGVIASKETWGVLPQILADRSKRKVNYILSSRGKE